MVSTRKKNLRWEEVDKKSIELSTLARHFELYNWTEGKSQKTIDWYNLSIKQFYRFLTENKRSTELEYLGEIEVREFILNFGERSNTTWHTYNWRHSRHRTLLDNRETL